MVVAAEEEGDDDDDDDGAATEYKKKEGGCGACSKPGLSIADNQIDWRMLITCGFNKFTNYYNQT